MQRSDTSLRVFGTMRISMINDGRSRLLSIYLRATSFSDNFNRHLIDRLNVRLLSISTRFLGIQKYPKIGGADMNAENINRAWIDRKYFDIFNNHWQQ